tara:strand:+ start:1443 stop:1799 length:357 start_codon:yes stop_codon:yes gene_type:complete
MRSIIERAVRLTAAQRKKRGQIARRTAKRRAFRRKQKERRMKTHSDLLMKANRAARTLFKKKYSSGKSYGDLSYAEKGMIDKRLERIPAARLAKIAKRLLPKLKKSEVERLKKVRARG